MGIENCVHEVGSRELTASHVWATGEYYSFLRKFTSCFLLEGRSVSEKNIISYRHVCESIKIYYSQAFTFKRQWKNLSFSFVKH